MALCLLLSSGAFAQQKEGGKRMDAEAKAEKMTEKMAEKLQLSEDQRVEILKLNTEYLRERENQQKIHRELKEQHQQKINAVLTEDQKEKMQEMKEVRHEKMKEKRRERMRKP